MTNYQFLRQTAGLPLTALIVRPDKSIAGFDGYIVRVMGYSKEEFWLKDRCQPYTPSPFMAEQLAGWMRNIGL